MIDQKDCNMAKAMDILGDKWKLYILRQVFYGIKRFSDIERNTNVSPNILTKRLKVLVDDELLIKKDYQEKGSRQRYEYHLSDKGRALLVILMALMQWGDTYMGDPNDVPLRLVYGQDKEPVHVALVTTSGQVVEKHHELNIEFWPMRNSEYNNQSS